MPRAWSWYDAPMPQRPAMAENAFCAAAAPTGESAMTRPVRPGRDFTCATRSRPSWRSDSQNDGACSSAGGMRSPTSAKEQGSMSAATTAPAIQRAGIHSLSLRRSQPPTPTAPR